MELTICMNELIIPNIGDKVYSGMRDQYEWIVCECSNHYDIITKNNIMYKSLFIKAKRKGNKKIFYYVSYNKSNIVKDLEELRQFNIKQQLNK